MIRVRLLGAFLVGVTALLPLATQPSTAFAVGCPTFPASVSAADAPNVTVYDFSKGLASPTDPKITPYQSYAKRAPLAGTSLPSQSGFNFVASKSITLRYGQMVYHVASGSMFTLECAGESKGAALKPSLFLESGRVLAQDPSSFSGAVTTLEGLYGAIPGSHGGLKFLVVRNPVKPITMLADFLESGYNSTQSVRGTTTVRIAQAGHLNITPYVGPRIGTCRHVQVSVLNSVRNSSVYVGLV